jgi:hypothetical protein
MRVARAASHTGIGNSPQPTPSRQRPANTRSRVGWVEERARSNRLTGWRCIRFQFALLFASLPQHSGRSGKVDRSHPPPRA